MSLLQKLFTPKSKPTGASFQIGTDAFTNVTLFKRKSGQVRNKAGNVSWRGLRNGKPVKIYQCFDETQAALIARMSERYSTYFPRCYAREGVFLVTDWVEGQSVSWQKIMQSPTLFSQVGAMQVAFHQDQSDISKDYYLSLLQIRIAQFQGILPIAPALHKIEQTLMQEKMPAFLAHPDITAANLVVDQKTQHLKIIDNELLTVTPYYLIDLFNTHKSMGKHGKDATAYLQNYQKNGGNLSPLLRYEDMYMAVWYLRMIGSVLQRGALSSAIELAERYIAGIFPPHPLIQWIKNNETL